MVHSSGRTEQKLTILINAVSAKSGGAATYIRNLANELARSDRKHRYLLCVPPQQAKPLQNRWPHVTVLSTEAGLQSPWKRFLWDQVHLRRIAQRERVDLLLSSSDFGMLFPPCRQILMIRNPLFFSPLYLREIFPRKSLRFKTEFYLRRRLIGLSARCSDLVLTASDSMLKDVRRFIPLPVAKSAVNPFGVPLKKFDRGTAERRSQGDCLRLLYVSEYSDYKNLTTLLKALLHLKESGANNFCLTTTADPKQFPEVEISSREADKTLASDPRIAGRLKITGPVPYEEIERLYRESDLFIFPSLAESFGHPLVEAMASGLPVIASDIPIHREICAEAAVYFDPLDPKDLAEKVSALLGDSALRNQLGQLGKNRAESAFHWEDHVKRLMEIFERFETGPRFSYKSEKGYYSRNWPKEAKPYRHLEPYLRAWLKPADVFKGKRVLDIGAGECTYTRLIAERFGPREVVACDLFSERLLPAARANRDPHLSFVGGDCYRLPFRDGCFEVVFGSLTLHQLPRLEQVVSEIRRVLSENGCYVGIEPNPFNPVHLARCLFDKHSPNQYLLNSTHLTAFRSAGFELTLRYFYAKVPWLQGRFFGSCMGIVAKRSDA